jgi:hypothetical protein
MRPNPLLYMEYRGDLTGFIMAGTGVEHTRAGDLNPQQNSHHAALKESDGNK